MITTMPMSSAIAPIATPMIVERFEKSSPPFWPSPSSPSAA
jgi:hypothetical protein